LKRNKANYNTIKCMILSISTSAFLWNASFSVSLAQSSAIESFSYTIQSEQKEGQIFLSDCDRFHMLTSSSFVRKNFHNTIKQRIYNLDPTFDSCDFSKHKVVYTDEKIIAFDKNIVLVPLASTPPINNDLNGSYYYFENNAYQIKTITKIEKRIYKITYLHYQFIIRENLIVFRTDPILLSGIYLFCGVLEPTIINLDSGYFDRYFGFGNTGIAVSVPVANSRNFQVYPICN
jgi:hypothetical protein